MTVQAKKLLNLTHVARLTHHEPRRHSIDAALTELTIKKIHPRLQDRPGYRLRDEGR